MRPTAAFVGVLLAWAGLGVLCAFGLLPLSAWQLAGVAIVLAASVDAARLWRVPDPLLRRELPAIVPVGVEREATVFLQAGDARAQHLLLHDLLPGDWASTGLPRAVDLHPGFAQISADRGNVALVTLEERDEIRLAGRRIPLSIHRQVDLAVVLHLARDVLRQHALVE